MFDTTYSVYTPNRSKPKLGHENVFLESLTEFPDFNISSENLSSFLFEPQLVEDYEETNLSYQYYFRSKHETFIVSFKRSENNFWNCEVFILDQLEKGYKESEDYSYERIIYEKKMNQSWKTSEYSKEISFFLKKGKRISYLPERETYHRRYNFFYKEIRKKNSNKKHTDSIKVLSTIRKIIHRFVSKRNHWFRHLETNVLLKLNGEKEFSFFGDNIKKFESKKVHCFLERENGIWFFRKTENVVEVSNNFSQETFKEILNDDEKRRDYSSKYFNVFTVHEKFIKCYLLEEACRENDERYQPAFEYFTKTKDDCFAYTFESSRHMRIKSGLEFHVALYRILDYYNRTYHEQEGEGNIKDTIKLFRTGLKLTKDFIQRKNNDLPTHSRWRIGNLFMMIPEKRQRFYERLMKKENLKRIRKIEKIETEECYQYDNYVTTKITLNY